MTAPPSFTNFIATPFFFVPFFFFLLLSMAFHLLFSSLSVAQKMHLSRYPTSENIYYMGKKSANPFVQMVPAAALVAAPHPHIHPVIRIHISGDPNGKKIEMLSFFFQSKINANKMNKSLRETSPPEVWILVYLNGYVQPRKAIVLHRSWCSIFPLIKWIFPIKTFYSDRLNVSIVFKSTAKKNDMISRQTPCSKTHFGWPRVHSRHLNTTNNRIESYSAWLRYLRRTFGLPFYLPECV